MFQCLIIISNDGKENIINFAKAVSVERLEEEKTGLDAEIVDILTTLKKDVVKSGSGEPIILTKTIYDKLNASREDQDKLKIRSVGREIKKLGFSARHTKEGNGWLYNEEHLKVLTNVYTPSTLSSPTSQTSPTSPQEEKKREVTPSIPPPKAPAGFFPDGCARKCFFCGEPIEGALHSHAGDKFSQPCHSEPCERNWRVLKGYDQDVRVVDE